MIEAAAYSPDGTRFAIAARHRGVEIRDAETGRLLVPLYGHAHQVRAVAWSPDGTILATGGDDLVVFLWDVSSSQRLAVMYGHEGPIIAVDFSLDGKRLLSASRAPSDDLACGTPSSTAKTAAKLRGHGLLKFTAGAVESKRDADRFHFCPTGRHPSVGPPIEQSRDPPIGRTRFVLGSVSWSPDGRYIASTSSDDLTCKLWDAKTGQEVRRFRGHLGEVVFFKVAS